MGKLTHNYNCVAECSYVLCNKFALVCIFMCTGIATYYYSYTSVPSSPPCTCTYCIGLQSPQSEAEGNDTNILRSLPSDDDNDNLTLVLQREESRKVKGEWSAFVSNGQLEETSN